MLSTEKELITQIILLSDKNKDKGITENHLLSAAEEMVAGEFHDVRLHRETFDPKHVSELIRRAENAAAKGK
ncbi:Uncharacterised protein [uncultured archaeon]|nr:Uncharacterised protein [uncultured archaeon]